MPAHQYVTTSDFDALVAAEVREKLYADESGNYQAALFNRAAQLASVYIRSKALNAGYTLPEDSDGTSTDEDMVRLATLSVLVRFAYSRMQQEIPEALNEILSGVPAELQTGETPLVDANPDAFHGVGGVKIGSSSSDGEARGSVFRDLQDCF
ncbi:MAG: hypothetical protein AAGE52_01215 [Myxococcota bacterium]